MTDRFDLEQQILQCWGVIDHIKMIRERKPTDIDEALKSLEILYQIQFEKCFEVFEEIVRQGHLYTKQNSES